MNHKGIRVSILIVNYFSESHIFEQIAALSAPNIEFIITDNSQTFPENGYLTTNTRVIKATHNLGFAVAVNKASELSNGEYLFILNPDVRIELNVLMSLIDAADEMLTVGVISPRLIEMKQSQNFLNGGKFPKILPIFMHFSGVSKLAGRFPFLSGFLATKPKRQKNYLKMDWVSGASMLMHKEFFRELGGFSEEWFMYSEDIELCLRIIKAGKSVVIANNLEAIHFGQESDTRKKAGDDSINVMWLINLADLYYKYFSRKSQIMYTVWCLIVSYGFATRLIYFRLRYSRQSKRNKKLQTNIERMTAYFKCSMHLISNPPSLVR